MSFWVKWFIFTGALFVPSVDLYMDQSMPLHMVVQTLIFLALGWAASARLEKVDFAAIDLLAGLPVNAGKINCQ